MFQSVFLQSVLVNNGYFRSVLVSLPRIRRFYGFHVINALLINLRSLKKMSSLAELSELKK